MIRFALLFSIITCAWTYVHAQTPRAEVAISISTKTPIVKTGSDVWINIILKNTSTRELSCMSAVTLNHVDMSFAYQVTGPSGKPLGKRKPKYPALDSSGSIYPCMFGPGKTTLPKRSLISAIFNMTKPGKYTVRVLRRTTQHTWVRSNLLHITVSP